MFSFCFAQILKLLSEAYTNDDKDPLKIIDVFGVSSEVNLNAPFDQIQNCRREIDSWFTTKALTVKCIKHEKVPETVSSLILPCLRYLDLQFTRADMKKQEVNYFEKYQSLSDELWKDNIPRLSFHQILNTLVATDSTGYPGMTIKISIDKFNVLFLDKKTLVVAFLGHKSDCNFFSHMKQRRFKNVALLKCQNIPDFDESLFETAKKIILHDTKPGNLAGQINSGWKSSFSKPDIKHKDVILINPEFDREMINFVQNLGFLNCYIVKNPDEHTTWSTDVREHVKNHYKGKLDNASFLLINKPKLSPQFLSIQDPLQVSEQLVLPIVFSQFEDEK